MKLKVTYADGETVQVNAGPRAQVALERQYGVGLGKAFDSEQIEYVYYLGWAALHFAGKEPKDFEGFLDRIADVEVESDDEADPTSAGQSPAPSAS